MATTRISLDGAWEFVHVADDPLPEPAEAADLHARTATVRTIQVPGPWQAQFADLRMKAGIGLYRREVELPAGWLDGRRAYLRFGAVFHNAKVWVNGATVGTHEGGFLPFAFDVTDHLVEGRNEVRVRAESPTDDATMFPDAPFAEIPFGKQSWYGPLSGIWQSVALERRHADHVAGLRLRPDLGTGRLDGEVLLARPLAEPAELAVEVRGPDGAAAAETLIALPAGADRAALGLDIAAPQPWSPDAPNLYRVSAALRRGGELLDEQADACGFRTIEAREGRLFLNGAPLYLRAALDQDYYPDTICTVPSLGFLEDQLAKAKALGLNCLRLHIKAPDPRYYEVADRLGMLVWTELPNGGLSTERSRARKRALLKGLVDRDGNHPSIVVWTIINENWGVDLVHDPRHRAWLKETYAWLKAYDPSRLVVDNSPLAPSFHVRTDIADYHYYAAIPDHRDEWDAFVERLATRSSWLFSPEGDAEASGEEPRLCSEFGNWGLPDPEALKDGEGREPWWFETGHDWGDGIMYAHGVENRFTDWSLDRVFGSLKGFVEAAQWQQFRALKYQIEAMRRAPSLAGYCLTELTDCHWESNGLLDMRRNPRVFHRAFRAINADTVIVPRWERLAAWAGETVRIELAVAHGAGAPLEGATLEMFLGDTRVLAVPRLEAGGVADLGAVELAAPVEAEPCLRRVAFELRGPSGAILATNHLDLAIHPARPEAQAGGAVWSPDLDIRARLRRLGFPLASGLDAAALVVATRSNEAIAAHVRAGGRLLLLPEAEGSLHPYFPHWQNVRVQSRDGTHWRGDWASSFAWLRRVGPFARLPGGSLLDETFDRVLPTHVVTGANLLDFQARVPAGLVVGWVHKPVALVVERAYGQGRVVVSTFRLFRDPVGTDPTATTLLDGLIALGAPRLSPEHSTAPQPVAG